MGYLLHILLALAANALYEAGFESGLDAPLVALLLVGLPHAAALYARASFLRGRFRLGGVQAFLAQHLAPLLHLGATCLAGWPRTVASWTGADPSLVEWPRPAILLLLVPYVVYELLAIDAKARLGAAARSTQRNLRRFHVRMLLSSLLPVVLYILLASAIGASATLRVQVEQVALYNALFGALLLAIFVSALPLLLRNTWETIPLAPGVQRSVLEEVARLARFRCRELLVWRTGHLMANAAIVGLGPRSRVVLFSDSLLAQLSPRELAAVFGHEIGHAVHRHVLIFVTWALAFFMGVDVLVTFAELESTWSLGALAAGGLAVWYFGFGWLSRRFELQADLYGIHLTKDPEALIGALDAVGGHLRDVAGWRHFSISDRVRFLRRAAADPRVERRLERTLRGWTRAGALAFVALAAVEVFGLVASLPDDRAVVDLRFGRYESALARVEAGADPDPDLAELARFAAAEWGAGAVAGNGEPSALPTAADFDRAAQVALAEGRPDDALSHLRLAVLRDFTELVGPAWVLERLADGELDEARSALEDLPPSWREALEPWVARE